jgi:hypothetical protein
MMIKAGVTTNVQIYVCSCSVPVTNIAICSSTKLVYQFVTGLAQSQTLQSIYLFVSGNAVHSVGICNVKNVLKSLTKEISSRPSASELQQSESITLSSALGARPKE